MNAASMAKPENIDEYINSYPISVQKLLVQVHQAIKKAAPQATEHISYGMPAFKANGILVWFAAHTHHIGFYPKASAILAFKKEFSGYKGAKGSVQFPFNEPLPLALIAKIVKFRLKENLDKAAMKRSYLASHQA